MTFRIESTLTRIEGFCNIPGWRSEQSVIIFRKTDGEWHTASSTCLPSDIDSARIMQECIVAVFAKLDEYSPNVKLTRENIILETREQVGWQRRCIKLSEGECLGDWLFCDAREAEILSGREDYELREVYADTGFKMNLIGLLEKQKQPDASGAIPTRPKGRGILLQSTDELRDFDFDIYWKENWVPVTPEVMNDAFCEVAKKAWNEALFKYSKFGTL